MKKQLTDNQLVKEIIKLKKYADEYEIQVSIYTYKHCDRDWETNL